MKGADAVMSTIVQYNDWLEEEVTGALSWERVHRLASRQKTSVLSQLVDLGSGDELRRQVSNPTQYFPG